MGTKLILALGWAQDQGRQAEEDLDKDMVADQWRLCSNSSPTSACPRRLR